MTKRRLGIALALMVAGPALAQDAIDANPFFPIFGSGQSLSVTTTSASISWTAGTPAGQNPPAARQIYIYSAGTGLAFCRWGIGTQTALTSDVAVPSGSIQTFNKQTGIDTLACITPSGTATIYAIPGNGS